MRKLLKFLHTLGAIGMVGAMACLVAMLSVAPPPSSLAGYALMREAMSAVSTWIFLPSLVLTLIAGLLAIAVNRGFHDAGWAWIKAATGILVFEGAFAGIMGPIQDEREQSARALAGQVDPATLGLSLGTERYMLYVLLGVAAANVVIGIWRPRLVRRRT